MTIPNEYKENYYYYFTNKEFNYRTKTLFLDIEMESWHGGRKLVQVQSDGPSHLLDPLQGISRITSQEDFLLFTVKF
jgi:hypothetical protein